VPVRRIAAAVSNPAQVVVIAFTLLVAFGTVLLALPFAFDGERPGDLLDSAFLATSAVTVTGLSTFDIERLSMFGELVVLVLIQVGGFGIMTIGSLLALLAARRLGLRQRMLAQTEIGVLDQAALRSLVSGIARITLLVEGSIALVVAVRLWWAFDFEPVAATYHGLFHAVSAFNNAGLALYDDNLIGFAGDPFIVLGLSVAFILGGLGFPVILQVIHRVRPQQWNLHTKVTVAGTGALVILGPLMVAAFEWSNPATLGPAGLGEKVLGAWFQGVSPRTAGFNVVDIGALEEPTLLGTTILMFIGGGPASTAGGIKVTTFAFLAFVLWSEVRGDEKVNVLHRQVPAAVIRQAVTVVVLAIGSVIAVTAVLLVSADLTLTPALFESVSAFATVGLSTGVTADLPDVSKLAVMLLMLTGRVGPTTLVAALAYRQRQQHFQYPVERPIIG